VVYDDNSDEEDDNISYRSEEDELLNENRSSDLEEEALGNDSDYLEELPDEDDASYCTESSFRSHSTLGSTPGTSISRRDVTDMVDFFMKRSEKASRIVQNGDCTEKRAFVYRVLYGPLACSRYTRHPSPDSPHMGGF